ncbi:MAG: thiol-activated cytolysin family protein, partial [Myxococcales bacterium]|nr:thiol-activated cytolysin family protein [Myxococcales bacterium]
SPVGTMEEPRLSTYREELLAILGQGTNGDTPASVNFTMEQVYSNDSLSRLLKTDVSWGKDNANKIHGMFDFNDTSERYKLAVDFVQSYFTVDIDTPALPAELFAPNVSLEEVEALMGEDNPPMLLQSVTYGRRAVLSIETTHDLTEVKAAFSAAIKSVVDVSASVDTKDRELLDSLDMKVFVLGGSGEAAIAAIGGFDGLMEFLKAGSTYSVESPGAPIAYKLTYLDNTGAKFALTTEFAEASCTKDMNVVVTAQGIVVESNGEGGGSPELSYSANVVVDGELCSFVADYGTDHGDGALIPLNVPCPFTLAQDVPHSISVRLWAQEKGGLFDKTKEAENAFEFKFDPAVGSWSPLIGKNSGMKSLVASNGDSGETLSLRLEYSVDLL